MRKRTQPKKKRANEESKGKPTKRQRREEPDLGFDLSKKDGDPNPPCYEEEEEEDDLMLR